jgi:hypothetical protein
MGAMMSGSLQAPLAALVAMLELTDNPEIILPGMLVVVISGLTASEVFGKESIFFTSLRAGGFRVDTDPLAQAQRRIGVASAMDRRMVQVGSEVSIDQARKLLQSGPRYLLVDCESDQQVLMPAAHLARFLAANESLGSDESIDLLSIPAQRWQVAAISLQANLQEASEVLRLPSVEALVVQRRTAAGVDRVFGVLTPEMVESAYRE